MHASVAKEMNAISGWQAMLSDFMFDVISLPVQKAQQLVRSNVEGAYKAMT